MTEQRPAASTLSKLPASRAGRPSQFRAIGLVGGLFLAASAVWVYAALRRISIEELNDFTNHDEYCGRFVKIIGVVSGNRRPGYETGYGDRGYLLEGKTRGGTPVAVEVAFDPVKSSAPKVGVALAVSGLVRCDSMLGVPFLTVVEQTRAAHG